MPQSQPTVVLIHGFLDAGEIWSHVLKAVGSMAADWLAPDLPGMGGQWRDPGPFTLVRYAETVAASINASDGPLVLIGHSMGAQVAELVSRRVSNPVHGLLLLSPVPLEGARLTGEMIDMLAATGGDERAQRAVRCALVAQPPDDKVVDWLTPLGTKVARTATEQIVSAWNTGILEGKDASLFEGPVLVASGSDDQFVNPLMAQAVASRFKNPSVTWIRESGHWPQVERPDLTAELIKFFVANCSEKAPAREDSWTKAFSDRSEKSFGEAFAQSVVFDASVLAKRVEGIERVKTILGAASRLYSKLEFTRKATDGNRTYMEWAAEVHDGEAVSGITILTRDSDGKISAIAIHHRPLNGVIHFSRSLASALEGKIEPEMFFRGP